MYSYFVRHLAKSPLRSQSRPPRALFWFPALQVSGVPLLEKAAKKRWGDSPAYQAYLKRTRLLLPLPKLFDDGFQEF